MIPQVHWKSWGRNEGTRTVHTHSALVRHQPLLHMSACSFFKLPESFIRYFISLKRMLKHKRVKINWQKVTQLVSDRAVIHISSLILGLRWYQQAWKNVSSSPQGFIVGFCRTGDFVNISAELKAFLRMTVTAWYSGEMPHRFLKTNFNS